MNPRADCAGLGFLDPTGLNLATKKMVLGAGRPAWLVDGVLAEHCRPRRKRLQRQVDLPQVRSRDVPNDFLYGIFRLQITSVVSKCSRPQPDANMIALGKSQPG